MVTVDNERMTSQFYYSGRIEAQKLMDKCDP